MRSSEVARIAGVSVRTLRHYHAMGLLAEPPRHANGYRDYGAADLARVLHIKRLAALGFPLSRIKDMLAADVDAAKGSEGTASADVSGAAREAEALDELDRELKLQIERLQEQRRTVALLRKEQLDPALPVEFARIMKRLFGDGHMRIASEAAAADRAAMMIAGQFYDEGDIAELERVATRLEDQGLMDDLFDVQGRADALTPDATEASKDKLVADGMALIESVLDCLDVANWDEGDEDETLELLTDSLHRETRNAAQLEVVMRLDQAIADYVARRRAEAGS